MDTAFSTFVTSGEASSLRSAAVCTPGTIAPPANIDAGGDEMRRRLRVGGTSIDIRECAEEYTLPLRASVANVCLLVVLSGQANAVTVDGDYTLRAGDAFLLARSKHAVATWVESGRAVILELPRARMQALVSAELDTPSRLGGVDIVLPSGRRNPEAQFNAMLNRLIAESDRSEWPAYPLEDSLLTALIGELLVGGNRDEIFPIAGSVKRAVDYVRANPRLRCSPEDLAAAAGVTAATLRQNFRACLGISIAHFVQNFRLDWAHARLSGGQESRAIAVLASDAGFSGQEVFARAYQKRFGEVPSQTRARAVKGSDT